MTENTIKILDYNAAYSNGYNRCIEETIKTINKILSEKYDISVSPKELLLKLKENILLSTILHANNLVINND